jgi:hypothetical protein
MAMVGGKSVGLAVIAAFISATATLGATGSDRPHDEKARIGRDVPERVVDLDQDTMASAPYRAHLGRTDLYIPTFFEPKDGTYDLIIHFHGLSAAQESNIERTRINAVVASINIGVGSGPYEHAFKDAWTFPNLVNVINRAVAKSGRAGGAHLGRIALSAWSAGYGSVSAILRQPKNVERIDAILLADGLHSDYADKRHHVVDDAPLGKYARIAEAAIRGDKLFALTHSSIVTEGYPNTTDTIGKLLKMVDVAKNATVSDGPRGMLEVYESHSGSFHVKGYLGTQVKDHIDHIWGMNDTMLPYLRDRWAR